MGFNMGFPPAGEPHPISDIHVEGRTAAVYGDEVEGQDGRFGGVHGAAVLKSVANSVSVRTATPSCVACASLEPGLSPVTTRRC